MPADGKRATKQNELAPDSLPPGFPGLGRFGMGRGGGRKLDGTRSDSGSIQLFANCSRRRSRPRQAFRAIDHSPASGGLRPAADIQDGYWDAGTILGFTPLVSARDRTASPAFRGTTSIDPGEIPANFPGLRLFTSQDLFDAFHVSI